MQHMVRALVQQGEGAPVSLGFGMKRKVQEYRPLIRSNNCCGVRLRVIDRDLRPVLKHRDAQYAVVVGQPRLTYRESQVLLREACRKVRPADTGEGPSEICQESFSDDFYLLPA